MACKCVEAKRGHTHHPCPRNALLTKFKPPSEARPRLLPWTWALLPLLLPYVTGSCSEAAVRASFSDPQWSAYALRQEAEKKAWTTQIERGPSGLEFQLLELHQGQVPRTVSSFAPSQVVEQQGLNACPAVSSKLILLFLLFVKGKFFFSVQSFFFFFNFLLILLFRQHWIFSNFPKLVLCCMWSRVWALGPDCLV